MLHGNPELQQELLDAAADITSAAVVAPLTFGTYFSLAGIDDQRQRERHAFHFHLHQDHLRPSQENIPVKLTAGRAGRKDITQGLPLAIPSPRESPSCLKTSHFDRSWLSRLSLSRPPKHKLRYKSWRRTISPFVTTA